MRRVPEGNERAAKESRVQQLGSLSRGGSRESLRRRPPESRIEGKV